DGIGTPFEFVVIEIRRNAVAIGAGRQAAAIVVHGLEGAIEVIDPRGPFLIVVIGGVDDFLASGDAAGDIDCRAGDHFTGKTDYGDDPRPINDGSIAPVRLAAVHGRRFIRARAGIRVEGESSVRVFHTQQFVFE